MIKKTILFSFILLFSKFISAQEGWSQITNPLKSIGYINISRDSILVISHDNSHMIVDSVYKIAYSFNSGKDWKLIALDNNVSSLYIEDSTHLWVGLFDYYPYYTMHGIYFTSDFGKNWEEKNEGLSLPYINSIYKTFNNTLISLTTDGVFKYVSSNHNWVKISNLSIQPAFKFIIKSYKNNEIMLAGGPYGYSLDNGESWKYYEPGYWRGNIIDLTKNLLTNSIFIGTWFYDYSGTKVKHGKIFKSTTYDANWEGVFDLPYNEFVVSLFNNKNGAIILVSTHRIFYSIDDGITWLQYTKVSSIENDIATSTLFKNKLYIGTIDGKLYKTTLDFIPNDVEEQIDKGYLLEQNYPNPFNKKTMIDYNTMNDGIVNISIYNILGEKMIDLINGYQEKGFHSICFNASNLCSGVYFYRITAGNYYETKKLVLLK